MKYRFCTGYPEGAELEQDSSELPECREAVLPGVFA